MKIVRSEFGHVDGQPVDLLTLENSNGMTVKITNYGGIVTSLVVPDPEGRCQDIACGFDTLDGYFSEAYQGNAPYFGCIVGRYAGRIKDGTFNVGGEDYQVVKNDGPNHLHGGIVGFDKRIWDAECVEDNDDGVVRLSLVSPDGEEGYPGTLHVTVEYRLTENNELRIRYQATTDRATPLSLTNHTYFNLSGFTENILNHEVQIASDRYLVPDETNVPVGEEQAVAGTACDFQASKRLGEAFTDLPLGFEHYYIFDNSAGQLVPVAEFSHEQTGRRLKILTTEPGMLFYTGRYTSDELAREDGTPFGQFRAFCCETGKYPNGPNIPGSPRSILEPGQQYDETTVFELG